MKDDAISRQAAIKTALTFFVEYLDGAFHEDMQAKLKRRFEEIPSSDVQPVRHGHWIEPSRHGVWIYDEKAYRECDQCHTPVYLAKSMKFCPECGARMDGEQE